MIKVLDDLGKIGMDKIGQAITVHYSLYSEGILQKKEQVIGIFEGFSSSVNHKDETVYNFFFANPEQNLEIILPIVRERLLHEEDSDYYNHNDDEDFDDVHHLNVSFFDVSQSL